VGAAGIESAANPRETPSKQANGSFELAALDVVRNRWQFPQAIALARAADVLLAAGLADEARPLVGKLAAVLVAIGGPLAEVIDLGLERTKRDR
jgi:hypothetical protein